MRTVMDNQHKALEKNAPTDPGQDMTDIWNYWQSHNYQATLGIKDHM